MTLFLVAGADLRLIGRRALVPIFTGALRISLRIHQNGDGFTLYPRHWHGKRINLRFGGGFPSKALTFASISTERKATDCRQFAAITGNCKFSGGLVKRCC